MGHELDITDGVASFADSRVKNGMVDAWHKLGTPVGRTMTPQEALDAAHMANWNVRKEPLVVQVPTPDGGTRLAPVEGKFAVVRDNPISHVVEPLGVVGRHWTPFQNEATTDLLYDITDQSGAHIETIGALDGGRRTFVTMKMPGHMEFVSPFDSTRDITELYLAVFNHHDGGGALRAVISGVRVVCANTQMMAENSAVSRVSLRHTGSPDARLQEVRDLLGITFAYQDTYVAECERMIAKQRDDEWVKAVLNDVFEVDKADTERARNARVERRTKVLELYRTAETVKPFYGTAYGAFNAVTEYMDHFAPLQGKKGDASVKRAMRSLTSPDVAGVKGRAFSALVTAS